MRNSEQYTPRVENEPRASFSEQILAIWKKKYPESFLATVEQRDQEKKRIEMIEGNIEHQEILYLLKEYGIDTKNIQIEALENGRFRIKVFNHFSKNRLPVGYAYEGSAARSLLMRNLNLDRTSVPRDVDVVRTCEEEPEIGLDRKVSMDFMPDDFERGNGVELFLNDDTYFKTRDFTINEVVATDDEIIATKQCILDIVRKIIRLTDFERQERYDGSVGSKMLAKVIRLYSENIHKYGEAEIANVEGWEFEENFISPFWLALQLDKACEISSGVAQKYVQEMVLRKQIPDGIIEVEEAAEYLKKILCGNPFYYRYAPSKQFQVENDLIDEYEAKFDAKKGNR